MSYYAGDQIKAGALYLSNAYALIQRVTAKGLFTIFLASWAGLARSRKLGSVQVTDSGVSASYRNFKESLALRLIKPNGWVSMRLFSYKGFSMLINLRDEHCPPHAHVDGGTWSARFKFSFWHNGVELWDVIPQSRRPPNAVLEGLRLGLKQPAHLRRARSIWWEKLQTACLDNQLWDSQENEVVVMKRITNTTYVIGSACYEPDKNNTLLALLGALEGVEIEL